MWGHIILYVIFFLWGHLTAVWAGVNYPMYTMILQNIVVAITKNFKLCYRTSLRKMGYNVPPTPRNQGFQISDMLTMLLSQRPPMQQLSNQEPNQRIDEAQLNEIQEHIFQEEVQSPKKHLRKTLKRPTVEIVE